MDFKSHSGDSFPFCFAELPVNWWHSANQSRRKGSTAPNVLPTAEKLISSSNTICFHFNAFLVGFLFVLEHMRLLGGQWQILISHSLLWGAHKDFASLFVLPLAPDPKNERIHPNLKQKSPPCLQQQHLAPSWALFQTPKFPADTQVPAQEGFLAGLCSAN